MSDSVSRKLIAGVASRVGFQTYHGRVLAGLAGFAAYGGIFFPVYQVAGSAAITLALVPVVSLAWLLGAKIGLVIGALLFPLNLVLLNLVGQNGWDVLTGTGGGALGSFLLLLVGLLVGWTSDLRRDALREIEARRVADEKFKGSQGQLRLLGAALEAAANGIVITDRGGSILWVNPAFAALTGFSPEEVLGKNPRIQNSSSQAREVYQELWETVLAGRTWRGELINRRKDGQLYTEEQTITPFRDETGEVSNFIAIKQDISGRKTNEARIEHQISQLQALHEIDRAITASLDPRVTFEVLLRQVKHLLSIDAADILTFDKHSQTLEFSAGVGFRTKALRYTRLKLGEGLAGRAAEQRQLVIIADLTAAPELFAQSPDLEQEGFVSYCAVPLLAKGTVQGVLEVFRRQPMEPDQEWVDFLEGLASQAAIAIDNAMLFADLNQSNTELRRAYDATLEGWARALELRDIETQGHSERVTEIAERLARKFGIVGRELVNVRRGSLLHDIGKMGVADSILHKPGKLTEEELEIMRRHPRYAYEMLSRVDHLRPALDIPYCHHERWDGSGYPRGLRGEEIPLAARIFAIVDVWDALRSERPYREAWSDEKALAHIQNERGKHFDPAVVDAFVDLIGSL